MFVFTLMTGCASKPVDTTKADYGTYPTNYVELIKEYLRDKLVDPFSAQYRMSKPYKAYTRNAPVIGGSPAKYGYIVDVAVNAKNKIGAYVGEKRFRLLIKNDSIMGTVDSNRWFSEPWFKPEFSNPLFKIPQLKYEDGLAYYKINDYEKALELFHKAANEGHAKAQYNLGAMYYKGIGVSKDLTKANEWLTLASEQGNTEAIKLKTVVEQELKATTAKPKSPPKKMKFTPTANQKRKTTSQSKKKKLSKKKRQAKKKQPKKKGCGSKRTCKQMRSCSEARYYLRNCGLKRLDRDRDGVPCEKLCR